MILNMVKLAIQIFWALLFDKGPHIECATLKFIMEPKMSLNSWSSCLQLSIAGISGLHYVGQALKINYYCLHLMILMFPIPVSHS